MKLTAVIFKKCPKKLLTPPISNLTNSKLQNWKSIKNIHYKPMIKQLIIKSNKSIHKRWSPIITCSIIFTRLRPKKNVYKLLTTNQNFQIKSNSWVPKRNIQIPPGKYSNLLSKTTKKKKSTNLHGRVVLWAREGQLPNLLKAPLIRSNYLMGFICILIKKKRLTSMMGIAVRLSLKRKFKKTAILTTQLLIPHLHLLDK